MTAQSPRSAIVTGGSSGIGQATAIQLAKDGCDVGITYRANRAGAEQVLAQVTELGRHAAVVPLDLSHPEDAPAAIERLTGELGGVDVLVNNAVFNRRVSILAEDLDGWQKTLEVNLIGPWACARAAASYMIDSGCGGRIVNVTSVLAFAAISGGAAYGAAKAGLEMLTKVMTLELASHGITVNAVAPGHTATPMNFSQAELDGSTIARPVIPEARAAAPEEIARAISFLASGGSTYTSGASLLVDGGLLLASGPETLQAPNSATARSLWLSARLPWH